MFIILQIFSELYHLQEKNGILDVMKFLFAVLSVLIIFTGCAPKARVYTLTPQSSSNAKIVSYGSLNEWQNDDLTDALSVFIRQCSSTNTLDVFHDLCPKAAQADDARVFFEDNFVPIALVDSDGGSPVGLMTGYYEPLLYGSLEKDSRYRYPLYGVPKELVTVELDSIYPELRGKKLRGRLDGGRLVPMPSREQIDSGEINASAICYVDNEIDLFFLQVQGSGRVSLDNGETIFVGYANENGHPYRSIGKEMIERGYIEKENISLQSIRAWFKKHPDKSKDILKLNPSFIFFKKREQGAVGSLGVELTPMRSLAVDRSFIPLGMPLYYDAVDPSTGKPMRHLGFAQDTGGAIKGQVRADLFFGFGEKAGEKAGVMKSPLQLWMLVPKKLLSRR